MTSGHLTLLDLNRRIARAVTAAPGLAGIWVTGETSDLRLAGGHCYMELLQKEESGIPVAKARAVIWASAYSIIARKFEATAGCALRSDMKVLVRVNVNYHPVYGLSLVINDIEPGYTVGDLARKRNEIIRRLQTEGLFDLNRSIPWPDVPYRVAIISAAGAAGYGDFVNHLHNNPGRLRFETTLFEASLQGENTVTSVIAALDAIMARIDSFDCVVIIRGGGAVADLAWFDDYSLALNVASFPIPIIVGIGHERDVTVLDYVANTRVKTPTAAAEFLLARVGQAYTTLVATVRDILSTVKSYIAAQRQQLAYCHGLIPALAQNAIARNRQNLDSRIAPMTQNAVRDTLRRQNSRLTALSDILDAISPEATLRRGYSITRVGGKALTDSAGITRGTVIETVLAKGNPLLSTVEEVSKP